MPDILTSAAQPIAIVPRPCPGCLAPDSRALGAVGPFPMRGCLACRTVFTAELPRPGEAEDYGAYYDEGNLEVPPLVHERLAELVSRFSDARQTNRWLDVGFGAGALLGAAAEAGWRVSGTEVAPEPVRRLAATGLDVRQGDLAAAAFPPRAFDVVTLIEVIEHVPEPEGLLRDVATVLRPGGVCYLTTPNGRGLSARLLGTRWSAVSPPEHLQLFSVGGLGAVARRAGLSPAKAVTHAVNPRELAGAVLPGRRLDPGDRVASGYALNAALTSSPSGRAVKTAVNGLLGVAGLGDTIKLTATRSR